MNGNAKNIFGYLNKHFWFVAEIILGVLLVAVLFEFFR